MRVRGFRVPDRGRPPRRLEDGRGSVALGFKSFWLACAEGDDASNRIVRRDADGDSVTRHDLDAESPHATAELSEHLVAGVALHAVKTSAVHRHDRALHVDKIVLAQTPAVLSKMNVNETETSYCATRRQRAQTVRDPA